MIDEWSNRLFHEIKFQEHYRKVYMHHHLVQLKWYEQASAELQIVTKICQHLANEGHSTEPSLLTLSSVCAVADIIL